MDTLNIGAMGSSVGVVAAVIVIVLVFLLLRRYSAAKGKSKSYDNVKAYIAV